MELGLFDEEIFDWNSKTRKRLEVGAAPLRIAEAGDGKGIYINLGKETAFLDTETSKKLVSALRKVYL